MGVSGTQAKRSVAAARRVRVLLPLPLGKGLRHDAGGSGSDAEQSLSGSLGATAALLPVLKCGNADADHESELRLELAEASADGLDVRGREVEDARRRGLATANTTGLTNALEQFFKTGLRMTAPR